MSPLVFSHIFYKLFSSLDIFPTLQPFSTIRNIKQLKGCSNEDATVMGKISIQIGSMANEALFQLSKHFANDGYIFLIVQVNTCQAFPYLCYSYVTKKRTIQGYSIIEQAPIQTNKTKSPYAEKFGYQGLPWITQIKV